MGLRNILFVISCIIVGFCLSLYFQTDQVVQTMNLDQYKNLQYQKERSHSLQEVNEKLSPYKLDELIGEIYEKNRLAGEKTRVMEIGLGNGRVLMELKKLFPEVDFYGINKEKTHTFYRRESFILTALKFEIFNKFELDGIDLPYIVFQDLDFGNRIPYDENKFDLVYSHERINKVKYKFELFNEIMRVLKTDGISLHTNFTGVNLYSKGIVVGLKDGLAEIRRKGIFIKVLENPTSLKFVKPSYNILFPLVPHQPIPQDTKNLPQELRRPEMGYNID